MSFLASSRRAAAVKVHRLDRPVTGRRCPRLLPHARPTSYSPEHFERAVRTTGIVVNVLAAIGCLLLAIIVASRPTTPGAIVFAVFLVVCATGLLAVAERQ